MATGGRDEGHQRTREDVLGQNFCLAVRLSARSRPNHAHDSITEGQRPVKANASCRKHAQCARRNDQKAEVDTRDVRGGSESSSGDCEDGRIWRKSLEAQGHPADQRTSQEVPGQAAL